MSCPLRLISYEPIVQEFKSDVWIEGVSVPVLIEISFDEFVFSVSLKWPRISAVHLADDLPERFSALCTSRDRGLRPQGSRSGVHRKDG